MISVVIPTITGREHLFEQTVAAYRETADVEVITVKNRTTCGEAWTAGAKLATGDFLHLSADDLIPHEGWAEAAIEAVASDWYPSPRLVRPDGSIESDGSMGGGMLLPEHKCVVACVSSPFPFMATTEWQEIGPCPPIHYYADDYLATMARAFGLSPMAVPAYCFTHLEGTHGRDRVVARSAQDRQTFLDLIAKGG